MGEGGTFDDLFTKDAGDWPDPIPLGPDLPPVPSLDPHLLPESFRPWLTDIADRMQAPLDFSAAAAVVAAGSAIGRRCGIKPQAHTDWSEVPNVWGALIGRPAMMKSPTLAAALGPIHKLEAEAALQNDAALKEYAQAIRIFDIRQKAAAETAKTAFKKKLKGGDTGATLELPEFETPECPPLRRYVLADATYEKAGEILSQNPQGVLVVRDELVGFLRPLSREENAAARAFWLEAWNGKGGYTFDRIIRGTIRLEACSAGVLGCIQPGKLETYLKEAIHGGSGDDGLIQRFGVMVYPDPTPEWRNVDRYPDTPARTVARDVYARLARIEGKNIGADTEAFDNIPCLRFAPEALRCFETWREELEQSLRGDGLHPALESHFAKYRKLVPALALIFHLIDCSTGGPVSVHSVGRACAWAEYLKAHAYRTYATVAQSQRAGARAILSHIVKADLRECFAVRDIQQKGWTGLTTAEHVRTSLEVLETHNCVRIELVPASATGGRPAERWRVNPRLRRQQNR